MIERYVLKEDQLYLVSDEHGDIATHNAQGHGLYWRDTRYLSWYELTLAGTRPTLLSAAGEHNFMNNLQFANAGFRSGEREVLPRTISIRRNRFISDGLHERIGFFNYNRFPVTLEVTITLGSDFRDMFDVRGYTNRATHGTIDAPQQSDDRLTLSYHGLDGVRRATVVTFTPAPAGVRLLNLDLVDRIQPRTVPGISGHGDTRTEYAVIPPAAEVSFEIDLPAQQHHSITLQILPTVDGPEAEMPRERLTLDAKFNQIRDSYRRWEHDCTGIETDRDALNAVILRANRDLRLLSDQVPSGYLPSAGIPWFSVPFGRDSLITSLQCLMLQPSLAYGSLRFLAANQGQRFDDWRDEEPGKILHEVRMGEVAALGQVPHTPYYGSVDSTPLFLIAFEELLRWTDDRPLAEELRPNAEAALGWLDRYGDLTGDGFVQYASRSPNGIRNQGWKDSVDAISHRDGRLAEPPIALAEVQGYVYGARQRMGAYYRRIGELELAAEQEARAAALKERFDREFWLQDEGFVALALGTGLEPVTAISSNPGHCLWTGLLDGERARLVARRLVQDDLNSGWGIRTLSSREPMFNPMSYHNGSVWPHDCAIVAAGLKRHGLDAEAAALIGEVLEAGMRFPAARLPELFCGFSRDRRYFSIPAQYPVSCSPQAWAAGSVFMMLQTLLGLTVDAAAARLALRPRLPDWLNRIAVRRLRVGQRRVDFEVFRERGRVRVEISDSGGLEIAVEPPRD